MTELTVDATIENLEVVRNFINNSLNRPATEQKSSCKRIR